MKATLAPIVERLGRHDLLLGDVGADARALPVDRLTSDSRRVAPGTLFCAVRGITDDGHRHLAHAAARGATAALVESTDPLLRLPQIRVADGRRAAAFAAAEFFGDPWEKLLLIGVTGTNGKTTT
ncbi:MAG TPA: Mur ligase domain-containing protein, partial [Longimicrobiaceae bacterium]|nr:Mur ligase domain-containing protein [Longimicrobiaceae bacterium]